MLIRWLGRLIQPFSRGNRSVASGLKLMNRYRHARRYILLFALTLGCVVAEPQVLLAQLSTSSLSNRAVYSYTDLNSGQSFDSISQSLTVPLIDPFGQLLGCGGNVLEDYTGFSMGLYHSNPADPTQTELGSLVSLTPTERPDVPDNNVPAGLPPNERNQNPFALSTQSKGTYNFLLDPDQGQTAVGQTFLLVITPPNSSVYTERRIKLEITGNDNTTISYRATSLDGQPIAPTGATTINNQAVSINDATQVGLQFFALQLSPTLCNSQQVQLIKSGDRAVAQPGDTVIYRLVIRNQTDIDLTNLTVTDALPLGFRLLEQSVRAEIEGQSYPIQVTHTGSNPVFQMSSAATLPVRSVMSLVYAAQLTPDAIRGTGRNAATVTAQRADNDTPVRDGPATHRVRIDPGLLSDCGTIIGRVFVDRNFDGEQQSGEPGMPNAVIFLDDGNRITTDADGLFSVANVLPGYRTGVLDPLSIPGYQIAPNHYVIEQSSPSRLVHLSPGGMVRMNFAVTPTHTGATRP